MTTETIEFRTWSRSFGWGDKPILTKTFHAESIGEIPKLACCTAWDLSYVLTTEIRWNYAGSLQGHYIDAKGI